MPLSIWGPLGWDWLHNLSICYKKYPSQNEAYEAYIKIKNFIENLPCPTCKTHAIQYIKQNPINLTSNKNFQLWVWNFHNSVNIATNKIPFTKMQYNKKYRQQLY